MRRRALTPAAEPVAAVNATPLIDVVLCMIVFFLIVGKLAATQRTPMQLPESVSGAPDMPPDSFVINILPAVGPGPVMLMVDNQEVTTDRIGPLLAARLARNPRVTVQIRAPRSTPYGVIEPAIEACAAAGVRDVRLATERADTPPAGRSKGGGR